MTFPLTPPRPGGDISYVEKERLSTLSEYAVLDSPPELSFDELAEAAAKVCGAPIALISFVDRERQWFKARIGTELQEMEREHSFCHFCIQSEERVMEVPDTMDDPLFRDNPLVKDAPYCRFYAGAPICVKEGHRLGTICVLDCRPRTLSSEQRRVLEILAERVADQLEMRRLRNGEYGETANETERRIVESEVEERQRIGKELHDGVVQTLAAAQMHADLLQNGASPKDKEEASIRLQKLIGEATEEIRGVGHSLMGKEILEKGLRSALEDLAENYAPIQEAPRIEVSVLFHEDRLEEVEAINLYRIVQEFVQNSMKHSNGQRIRIQGGMEGNALWMILDDDGDGMDPQKEQTIGGVRNMEHRVRFLGGRSRFTSSQGNGVRLTLELPLSKRNGE